MNIINIERMWGWIVDKCEDEYTVVKYFIYSKSYVKTKLL